MCSKVQAVSVTYQCQSICPEWNLAQLFHSKNLFPTLSFLTHLKFRLLMLGNYTILCRLRHNPSAQQINAHVIMKLYILVIVSINF